MVKQCAFINTEDNPIKIDRLGLFQCHVVDYKSGKLAFSEMCELWYPHPDAPEHAIVSIYRFLSVDILPGTEHLAKQACDAIKGLSKITSLR